MDADLGLYNIFCTVAKNGSLSKAAQELQVSQPAISQAMHKLEKNLDCKLFTRTSRGVVLTAEGELLFSYADKAVGLISAVEDKLYQVRHLQSGVLKLGASDTLCQSFLLPHLARFRHKLPNIQLQVVNRTTPQTIELLKAGKVDLAVVNLPVDDEALDVVECKQVHDVFIASEMFNHLKGKPVTLHILANEPLVLLEQASNSRKFVDAQAAKYGIRLAPRIELGAHSLLIDFARIGLGVACVTREYAGENFEEDSDLFEIELDPPLPPRAVGLITLSGVPLSTAAEGFRKTVFGEDEDTPGY